MSRAWRKAIAASRGSTGTLGEHIRPVLGERLRRDLLAPSGPFALGAIVDLGEVQDAGSAPMVEDRRFEPGATRRSGASAQPRTGEW